VSNWRRKLKRHVLDEPPRALIMDERHPHSLPRSPFYDMSMEQIRELACSNLTHLERGRAVHQALETMLKKGTANEKNDQE
jgi:hypothetical protein